MEKLPGELIVIDGKRIVLSFGETGLVFATSPDVKGLLVAKHGKEEALAAVPGALAALVEAKTEWDAMSEDERQDFVDENEKRLDAVMDALQGAGQEYDAAPATAQDERSVAIHELMDRDHEALAQMGDDAEQLTAAHEVMAENREALAQLAESDVDANVAAYGAHGEIPVENADATAATPDRSLVTIRMVDALRPIPDADMIEIAEVGGWQVVVKKGEFKVGDLGVFYEIDSFLPERPEYEFLRKSCYRTNYDGSKGFRLKTIRLRGQLSQGLLLSIKDVFSCGATIDDDFVPYDMKEGEDVTVALGVTKWEKPIPAHLAGRCKGNFPTHLVPKTDEPRIQNLSRDRARMQQASGWYVREKLDGSSLTFFMHKGEFGVCSRNIWLMETEDNAYWQVIRANDIEAKLATVCELYKMDLAVQGELCGPGIQGNHYKLLAPALYLFSVYSITEQKYLSDTDLVHVADLLDLPTAPLYNVFQDLPETTAEILEFSNKNSLVCPGVDAEGSVWRCYDVYGHRQHSFKAISNAFLLKEKD